MSEITTEVGKHFWKESSRYFTGPEWSVVHRTIVAVENEMRERIAREIEQIDLGGPAQVNGLGMRMLAAKVARGI